MGVAAFVDTTLPTHSNKWTDDDFREYAMLQMGGAVSAKFLGVQLGAALQAVWIIMGDDKADGALIGVDFYGGYKLLGMLNATLAFSYLNQVHPASDHTATPLTITPGLEVNPIGGLRAGAACRIAVNDDARLLYVGRAALLLQVGYTF